LTLRSRSNIAATVVAAVVSAGIIALTHFGTPDPDELDAAPAPEASNTPSIASGPDARAQTIVVRALEAEGVYYVDHVKFAAAVGAELAELRKAEPSLAWGREVMVVVPAFEGADSPVVVVRVVSETGRVFCGAEVSTRQDAGTWFAATVNAPCPPVAPNMPGWSTDPIVGWL
jgi:hypothetical protein